MLYGPSPESLAPGLGTRLTVGCGDSPDQSPVFLPGIVGSTYRPTERNSDRNRLAMPPLGDRARAGPDSAWRLSPRNASATAGFPRTTIAQMPNGSPSSQMGDPGMVARMAAAPAHA